MENVKIRCNNCMTFWNEEDLELFFNEKCNEHVKGCPTCKTDGFLIDLMQEDIDCQKNITEGQALKNELAHFSGTEQYHYCSPFKHFNYTDGVKHFFNNAGGGAYWLLTLLATEFYLTLDDEFYIIELKVNEDSSARLTAKLDSDTEPLITREIPYTDTPYHEEPYKFYLSIYKDGVERTVLLLPSEY